jgi:hypothetical protein
VQKAWVIRDADRHFYRLGVRRATEGSPFADEKNPARAYSLSMLFWGRGQSYSGQRKKGLMLQVLMIIFLTGIIVSALCGRAFLGLLENYGISRAHAFLSAELLFFVALIFWTGNADDAYHAAAKARKVPFAGVKSRVRPLLCSLLIPGWGQYMNGQPIKGSMFAGFSVLGIFSLVSVPAVLLCWPYLEASPARFFVEIIFTLAVIYAPLIPGVWLFSGYDAWKVSCDDAKKESLVDRISDAINRRRSDGWVRSVFTHMKSTAVIALFLALILVGMNQYSIPASVYSRYLSDARLSLQMQGMTLVPDLIERLLSGAAVEQK